MDKETEARNLIDPLFDKIDNGEVLAEYEQALFDMVNWLYDGGDKPEIEN